MQVVTLKAQRHVGETTGSSQTKPHQRNILSTSTRPPTPCPQELCRHRSHASAGKRHRHSDSADVMRTASSLHCPQKQIAPAIIAEALAKATCSLFGCRSGARLPPAVRPALAHAAYLANVLGHRARTTQNSRCPAGRWAKLQLRLN